MSCCWKCCHLAIQLLPSFLGDIDFDGDTTGLGGGGVVGIGGKGGIGRGETDCLDVADLSDSTSSAILLRASSAASSLAASPCNTQSRLVLSEHETHVGALALYLGLLLGTGRHRPLQGQVCF